MQITADGSVLLSPSDLSTWQRASGRSSDVSTPSSAAGSPCPRSTTTCSSGPRASVTSTSSITSTSSSRRTRSSSSTGRTARVRGRRAGSARHAPRGRGRPVPADVPPSRGARRPGLHRFRGLHHPQRQRRVRGLRHQARPPREDQRAPAARRLRRADADTRHPDRAAGPPRPRRPHDHHARPRRHRARVPDPAGGTAAGDRRADGGERRAGLGRPALQQLRTLPDLHDAGRGPPRPRARRGMRLDQRTKLIRAGVRTIDDLADRIAAVPAMSRSTQDRLVRQARLQVESEAAGSETSGSRAPVFEVADPRALDAIPTPDAGDVFFDFEGDPLYTEDGVHWGIDYLFGLVDPEARFTAFWAHTLRDERQALVDFLEFVRVRREQYPDMHIYHYAAYERTHLLSSPPGTGWGGRRRRPPARGRPRRPLPDRSQGPRRRQPQLLDQEARAAVHGRRPADERRHERRRQHHRLRRRDRGTPER